MATIRLSTVVVTICAVSALCFPSKPLNERSPDLAWQAWLLVDDQNNQHGRQNDGEGALRRRITPKSVFIAPTFSPENLPPCAEGYASDPMGRCMKIFKVDEDAHLEFLLQKIRDKFGDTDNDYEDYGDEEEGSTPGPFQLNIPLGGEGEMGEAQEETDMAIVVAPTNANFNQEEVILKLDRKRQDDGRGTTIVRRVEADKKDADPEPEAETTTASTTSTEPNAETTTGQITESTAPTTESDFTTTTTFQTTTDSRDEYTTTLLPTTETLPAETTAIFVATRIRFPAEEDDRPTSDFVRFPAPHTRDTSSQLGHLVARESANFYRGPAIVPQDFSGGPRPRSHRSRDGIPSRWSGGTGGASYHPQKPLVFRFSRKNSYVDAHQFKQPDFYRAFPTNDLSYIFGFKHRRLPNR